MSHEIPEVPWLKLACDFFEYNKVNYLIVVDYYSKFFEIAPLNNLGTQNVITHFKSIFARHGIPKMLVCDSGSQFTSSLFKQFSEQYEFDFVCSSPYHHQSNGLAEAHVKIVKNLLKKCKQDGTDPYLAILNFRNTPKNNSPSPANLLFSRTLRTRMPCHVDNLKPNVKNISNSNNKLDVEDSKISSRDLKPVVEGDNVYFKKDVTKPWVKGKVVQKCAQPRSFIVKDLDDNKYRRNRVHIKLFPKKNIVPSPHSSPEVNDPVSVSRPKRGPKPILYFSDQYDEYY
ncbi:hypothetical protein WDU94_005561 [Cyamophila willieti]